MKYVLLLTALVSASAIPAHAMTEETNHYYGSDQRSHYADPDDGEEQFNDAPHGTYSGQSGRERQLLQGNNGAGSQTYGFGGYDNSWTQSRTYSGNQSGFYYGVK